MNPILKFTLRNFGTKKFLIALSNSFYQFESFLVLEKVKLKTKILQEARAN